MAVVKIYRNRKVTPKDPNYSKGTWYVQRMIHGKRINKALRGCFTKEQAEAAERQIIQSVFNQQFHLIDTTTTLADFVEDVYLPYATKKNVNIASKKYYARLFKDYFKRTLLTAVTPDTVRKFLGSLEDKDYSASYLNEIKSTLSVIFTLACQERILTENPCKFIAKFKEPEGRTVLLNPAQRKAFWEEVNKDIIMKPLVTLAVNLPARRGQLLAIREEDIDFERRILRLIPSKGRAERFVPMNTAVIETLKKMIEDGLIPFPLIDIRKRWFRITQAAGINRKRGKDENMRGQNFTFHDLRHEFASQLVRNNINPEIIRQLFAHSDQTITQIYTNTHFDQLHEAVDSLK